MPSLHIILLIKDSLEQFINFMTTSLGTNSIIVTRVHYLFDI